MNRIRTYLLAMMLVLPLMLMAEEGVMHRLTFRSGRVMVVQIVLQNEEVVIVKDSRGARFQFPMSDIQEITELKADEPEQAQQEEKSAKSMSNVKRTSLGIHVAGGLASMGGKTGGSMAADFRLGANNVGKRQIFLGGQVGYRGLMMPGKTYSVLPIDIVMELPLVQAKHAPMLGANIGYGIGLGKDIRGGVNAGLTFGYRYHFSRTGAFHIGLQAEVQQLASITHSVSIGGDTFVSSEGQTAVLGMLSIGVLF